MKVSLAGAEIAITPQHYQRLVKKIMGKPEERILSYLMLRSLKQARYAADPLGHFALGFDEYTHFTSPIRRYPDLIIHRILKWALENPGAKPSAATTLPSDANITHARITDHGSRITDHGSRITEHGSRATDHGSPLSAAVRYTEIQLREIATESSEAERRAAAAERELMDWKTAQFMEEHLGEEYEGLIISVQKFGCFVELAEIFVEGLLPIAALEDAAGARCTYREFDHSIVAMTSGSGFSDRSSHRGATAGHVTSTRKGRGAKPSEQRSWHLGDPVHVRAERIDPIRKRVEFALTDS